MSTVCVLGEGAFGTAVAMVLADNGHHVNLWCYYEHAAESIAAQRCNPLFLPDKKLSVNIIPYLSIKDAVKDADYIVEAIPVKYLRSVCESTQPYVSDSQIWVMLSKGIENETLQFPSQILDDVMKRDVLKSVIAGPSFAKELALKDKTGVTLAATDDKVRNAVYGLFDNEYLSLELTDDVIGVQVCAALKNVIALAAGMLEGVTDSQNSKALLVTRGLHEIMLLIESFGGKPQTAYGLSGVGDVILSTFGTKSRNLEVGKRFGQGQSLDDIIKQTGYIPEGVNTTRSIFQLTQKHNLSLPLCSAVYKVLFEQASIDLLLDCLSS